ncbi:rhodanese-like protein [Ostertagia ostertagi]
MSIVVLQRPLISQGSQDASNDASSLNMPPLSRKYEIDITANHLLTLLITKRKICLFEASTGDEVISREQFLTEHIETARLLYHSNLSHSGVPVHPLQFQRYMRSLGVDNDCHVVIYDRGQMIWSTYAAWIFKLFGHRRVSILSGGFLAWKAQQARSSQYHTDSGDEVERAQGNLLSSWNQSLVITFDDVLLNTELRTFDVVDAQTKEEYDGEASGALYGHIRGAVNVPVDAMYDWKSNKWRTTNEIQQIFLEAGLSRGKPVIVYCSTSLRSSLIWWSLKRLDYDARIYFGGWPEWVVRAPDDLKVLGKNIGNH